MPKRKNQLKKNKASDHKSDPVEKTKDNQGALHIISVRPLTRRQASIIHLWNRYSGYTVNIWVDRESDYDGLKSKVLSKQTNDEIEKIYSQENTRYLNSLQVKTHKNVYQLFRNAQESAETLIAYLRADSEDNSRKTATAEWLITKHNINREDLEAISATQNQIEQELKNNGVNVRSIQECTDPELQEYYESATYQYNDTALGEKIAQLSVLTRNGGVTLPFDILPEINEAVFTALQNELENIPAAHRPLVEGAKLESLLDRVEKQPGNEHIAFNSQLSEEDKHGYLNELKKSGYTKIADQIQQCVTNANIDHIFKPINFIDLTDKSVFIAEKNMGLSSKIMIIGAKAHAPILKAVKKEFLFLSKQTSRNFYGKETLNADRIENFFNTILKKSKINTPTNKERKAYFNSVLKAIENFKYRGLYPETDVHGHWLGIAAYQRNIELRQTSVFSLEFKFTVDTEALTGRDYDLALIQKERLNKTARTYNNRVIITLDYDSIILKASSILYLKDPDHTQWLLWDDKTSQFVTMEGKYRPVGVKTKIIIVGHGNFMQVDSFKPEVLAKNIIAPLIPAGSQGGKISISSCRVEKPHIYVKPNYDINPDDLKNSYGGKLLKALYESGRTFRLVSSRNLKISIDPFSSSIYNFLNGQIETFQRRSDSTVLNTWLNDKGEISGEMKAGVPVQQMSEEKTNERLKIGKLELILKERPLFPDDIMARLTADLINGNVAIPANTNVLALGMQEGDFTGKIKVAHSLSRYVEGVAFTLELAKQSTSSQELIDKVSRYYDFQYVLSGKTVTNNPSTILNDIFAKQPDREAALHRLKQRIYEGRFELLKIQLNTLSDSSTKVYPDDYKSIVIEDPLPDSACASKRKKRSLTSCARKIDDAVESLWSLSDHETQILMAEDNYKNIALVDTGSNSALTTVVRKLNALLRADAGNKLSGEIGHHNVIALDDASFSAAQAMANKSGARVNVLQFIPDKGVLVSTTGKVVYLIAGGRSNKVTVVGTSQSLSGSLPAKVIESLTVGGHIGQLGIVATGMTDEALSTLIDNSGLKSLNSVSDSVIYSTANPEGMTPDRSSMKIERRGLEGAIITDRPILENTNPIVETVFYSQNQKARPKPQYELIKSKENAAFNSLPVRQAHEFETIEHHLDIIESRLKPFYQRHSLSTDVFPVLASLQKAERPGQKLWTIKLYNPTNKNYQTIELTDALLANSIESVNKNIQSNRKVLEDTQRKPATGSSMDKTSDGLGIALSVSMMIYQELRSQSAAQGMENQPDLSAADRRLLEAQVVYGTLSELLEVADIALTVSKYGVALKTGKEAVSLSERIVHSLNKYLAKTTSASGRTAATLAIKSVSKAGPLLNVITSGIGMGFDAASLSRCQTASCREQSGTMLGLNTAMTVTGLTALGAQVLGGALISAGTAVAISTAAGVITLPLTVVASIIALHFMQKDAWESEFYKNMEVWDQLYNDLVFDGAWNNETKTLDLLSRPVQTRKWLGKIRREWVNGKCEFWQRLCTSSGYYKNVKVLEPVTVDSLRLAPTTGINFAQGTVQYGEILIHEIRNEYYRYDTFSGSDPAVSRRINGVNCADKPSVNVKVFDDTFNLLSENRVLKQLKENSNIPFSDQEIKKVILPAMGDIEVNKWDSDPISVSGANTWGWGESGRNGWKMLMYASAGYSGTDSINSHFGFVYRWRVPDSPIAGRRRRKRDAIRLSDGPGNQGETCKNKHTQVFVLNDVNNPFKKTTPRKTFTVHTANYEQEFKIPDTKITFNFHAYPGTSELYRVVTPYEGKANIHYDGKETWQIVITGKNSNVQLSQYQYNADHAYLTTNNNDNKGLFNFYNLKRTPGKKSLPIFVFSSEGKTIHAFDTVSGRFKYFYPARDVSPELLGKYKRAYDGQDSNVIPPPRLISLEKWKWYDLKPETPKELKFDMAFSFPPLTQKYIYKDDYVLMRETPAGEDISFTADIFTGSVSEGWYLLTTREDRHSFYYLNPVNGLRLFRVPGTYSEASLKAGEHDEYILKSTNHNYYELTFIDSGRTDFPKLPRVVPLAMDWSNLKHTASISEIKNIEHTNKLMIEDALRSGKVVSPQRIIPAILHPNLPFRTGFYDPDAMGGRGQAVLWNPCRREFVALHWETKVPKGMQNIESIPDCISKPNYDFLPFHLNHNCKSSSPKKSDTYLLLRYNSKDRRNHNGIFSIQTPCDYNIMPVAIRHPRRIYICFGTENNKEYLFVHHIFYHKNRGELQITNNNGLIFNFNKNTFDNLASLKSHNVIIEPNIKYWSITAINPHPEWLKLTDADFEKKIQDIVSHYTTGLYQDSGVVPSFLPVFQFIPKSLKSGSDVLSSWYIKDKRRIYTTQKDIALFDFDASQNILYGYNKISGQVYFTTLPDHLTTQNPQESLSQTIIQPSKTAERPSATMASPIQSEPLPGRYTMTTALNSQTRITQTPIQPSRTLVRPSATMVLPVRNESPHAIDSKRYFPPMALYNKDSYQYQHLFLRHEQLYGTDESGNVFRVDTDSKTLIEMDITKNFYEYSKSIVNEVTKNPDKKIQSISDAKELLEGCGIHVLTRALKDTLQPLVTAVSELPFTRTAPVINVKVSDDLLNISVWQATQSSLAETGTYAFKGEGLFIGSGNDGQNTTAWFTDLSGKTLFYQKQTDQHIAGNFAKVTSNEDKQSLSIVGTAGDDRFPDIVVGRKKGTLHLSGRGGNDRYTISRAMMENYKTITIDNTAIIESATTDTPRFTQTITFHLSANEFYSELGKQSLILTHAFTGNSLYLPWKATNKHQDEYLQFKTGQTNLVFDGLELSLQQLKERSLTPWQLPVSLSLLENKAELTLHKDYLLKIDIPDEYTLKDIKPFNTKGITKYKVIFNKRNKRKQIVINPASTASKGETLITTQNTLSGAAPSPAMVVQNTPADVVPFPSFLINSPDLGNRYIPVYLSTSKETERPHTKNTYLKFHPDWYQQKLPRQLYAKLYNLDQKDLNISLVFTAYPTTYTRHWHITYKGHLIDKIEAVPEKPCALTLTLMKKADGKTLSSSLYLALPYAFEDLHLNKMDNTESPFILGSGRGGTSIQLTLLVKGQYVQEPSLATLLTAKPLGRYRGFYFTDGYKTLTEVRDWLAERPLTWISARKVPVSQFTFMGNALSNIIPVMVKNSRASYSVQGGLGDDLIQVFQGEQQGVTGKVYTSEKRAIRHILNPAPVTVDSGSGDDILDLSKNTKVMVNPSLGRMSVIVSKNSRADLFKARNITLLIEDLNPGQVQPVFFKAFGNTGYQKADSPDRATDIFIRDTSVGTAHYRFIARLSPQSLSAIYFFSNGQRVDNVNGWFNGDSVLKGSPSITPPVQPTATMTTAPLAATPTLADRPDTMIEPTTTLIRPTASTNGETKTIDPSVRTTERSEPAKDIVSHVQDSIDSALDYIAQNRVKKDHMAEVEQRLGILKQNMVVFRRETQGDMSGFTAENHQTSSPYLTSTLMSRSANATASVGGSFS
ncbi:TcdA/TcdB catalytic glycosyltransferase domain-containing protein [Endozoicomonas euniceicola]|uniref:C80 family cysteine peptidase n=1 Tax=Endozoicomonas euniceicola TaxID=1234143 RepID=A0ABY6GZA7_9GAMM|nr:TcdA/TcdB catalytic glycosyltransferase domain-containing protein [Endozoicomonas euniceicola]UYM17239.1 C80 family cysteine peptidase [Endozoicomonas euniceicola]